MQKSDYEKQKSLATIIRHWHKLPRQLVESSPLGVFKDCGDVTPRDVVSGHDEDGLRFNWMILEGFSNLNDSMIRLLCSFVLGL